MLMRFENIDRLIRYCKTTRDYLCPSVWGPVQKGEDPYAPQASGGVSFSLKLLPS